MKRSKHYYTTIKKIKPKFSFGYKSDHKTRMKIYLSFNFDPILQSLRGLIKSLDDMKTSRVKWYEE